MVNAVYPGTFNPITFGHIDLLKCAIKIFDHVIVAVVQNSTKTPLFTIEERVGLAHKVLSDYQNITVIGFNNLLVDFTKEHNASVI